jgi:hypothetical protein
MDRPKLLLAGCGLAVLLAAPGCRSTRNEVPRGKAHTPDGREMPNVDFSSAPRPQINPGINIPSSGAPGSAPQYGTPTPGATERFGAAPNTNVYAPQGAPGATGVAPAPATSAPGQAPFDSTPPSN